MRRVNFFIAVDKRGRPIWTSLSVRLSTPKEDRDRSRSEYRKLVRQDKARTVRRAKKRMTIHNDPSKFRP